MTRIAHEIVIDKPRRRITIDGHVLPWHTDIAGPSVEAGGPYDILIVRIGFIADHVTVINDDGEPNSHSTQWLTLEDELVWARGWVHRYANQVRSRIGLPPGGDAS